MLFWLLYIPLTAVFFPHSIPSGKCFSFHQCTCGLAVSNFLLKRFAKIFFAHGKQVWIPRLIMIEADNDRAWCLAGPLCAGRSHLYSWIACVGHGLFSILIWQQYRVFASDQWFNFKGISSGFCIKTNVTALLSDEAFLSMQKTLPCYCCYQWWWKWKCVLQGWVLPHTPPPLITGSAVDAHFDHCSSVPEEQGKKCPVWLWQRDRQLSLENVKWK